MSMAARVVWDREKAKCSHNRNWIVEEGGAELGIKDGNEEGIWKQNILHNFYSLGFSRVTRSPFSRHNIDCLLCNIGVLGVSENWCTDNEVIERVDSVRKLNFYIIKKFFECIVIFRI